MPVVGRTYRKTFAASAAAVGPARAQVAELAAAAGADPERVGEIRLAVSEAITNAVLHGYRGEPGEITVRARASHGHLWVTVADEGGGIKVAAEQPGLGLGLGIISQLSDELALLPGAAGGTEVRIRFDLAPSRRGEDRFAVLTSAVAA